MNDITATVTETTAKEQTAIELRKTGATLAKIIEVTGLPERRVRQLVKGVAKPARTAPSVAKIETPFAKSIERVFPLASRKQGIRDYELRDILHAEYGSTWNTSTGRYDSNYTVDQIKRVKDKVRKRGAQEGCNVMFLPDWIDESNPRASNDFLISAASDLMNRVDEYVAEYMAAHRTMQESGDQLSDLAQRKQRYAVQQRLLKLAVPGYGAEPLEKLLERTAKLIGELEGNPDIQAPEAVDHAGDGAPAQAAKYFPEPSRKDAFLDFVHAQGWTKPRLT
ncbi:hypothetical protein JFU48_17700 [Pseudomonas sp. TH49]|uniref:hypothetical protein n=1 Tax=Pseudomonas sp. TH49 TaxID=2796413 RepID=UPI001912070C|nr:hypothetical protein [Pseudomonas sp. TH49]MBK5343205.1 hypothetical protein [Pseudomonas sp. TH49]